MTTDTTAVGVSLAERILEATTGTLELFGIYLGDRLGLYEALRTTGAVTADELAETAGIAPRYAREWLEQQAAAGALEVDDVTVAAEARMFTVPEHQVGTLAGPADLDHVVPLASMVVGVANVLDEVVEAYRTGG